MKKLLLIALGCLMSLMMFGCSSGNANSNGTSATNNNSTQAEQSNTPDELIVSDSNYTISESGYVHYAVEIQNPNENYAAEFATITVTGKHADGTISFSDEWVISNLLPESTSYWANQAGDGDSVQGDTISFSVAVNDRNWSKSDQKMPTDLYTFDNVTVKTDQFDDLSAKGEITLNEDMTVGTNSVESPMLVCILKDANGKIVTGFSGYIYSDLKVGTSSVFDINSYFEAPEYSTAEMYANPW